MAQVSHNLARVAQTSPIKNQRNGGPQLPFRCHAPQCRVRVSDLVPILFVIPTWAGLIGQWWNGDQFVQHFGVRQLGECGR